jgi:5'-nucleotidase
VPKRPIGGRIAIATAAMLTALALTAPVATIAKPTGTVDVQLLAINDFHGNLQPPSGSSGRVGSAANDAACLPPTCYLAGGVQYLATHIKNLEATNPNRTLVVAAGDLIGATPLVSAAFHDEPTIEAMNALGLDITAVGNHEFDEGVDELLRMQNGGCHPVDGCQDGDGFDGADFQYLAANVVRKSNGKPIFPAYKVRSLGGAKIGFIGLTLEGTPLIVSQSGIQTVDFLDEAATINAATAELKAKGIHTIVVLIHEGGAQASPLTAENINTCSGMAGAITGIVAALDDEVDLVVSGHTHSFYNCALPNSQGRSIPVSSASSFGRLVTDIDMTIDRATGQPVGDILVDNKVVTRDVALDPDETTILNKYLTAVAPIANRIVGSITADITRTATAAGESALGDVIADAQLWYSQGENAQIAFMNPGGIRADLTYAQISGGEAPGEVTYGEVFNVQPFNNFVSTQDLTGAQIETILNQQWAACTPPGRSGGATVILQVSAGFTYQYDTSSPCGSRIYNMRLNGVLIDPGTTYRVTMNNFLADGGDSFPGFTAGTNRVNGGFDVDAFAEYLGAFSPVAPGPRDRISFVPS